MPLFPALLNRIAAAGLLVIGCAAHAQGTAQAAVSNASTPPPGTMTGAYGQSLQQQQAAVDKATPAAAKPAQSGTAGDAVSRFLSERGLMPGGEPGGSSRLLASVRDTASDLVLSAMNFLGVRYTRGGNSVENGFDCSGFTRHIFESSVGLVLPRRADEQASAAGLLKVGRAELRPGDLVFFNTLRRTFSHVGIYVGDGKFIHSPKPGGEVRVESMNFAYWAKRFTGARRVDLPSPQASLTTMR